MPPTVAPWLEPSPPWLVPVNPALCAGLNVAADRVPVVDVLTAPCSLAEVVAVRAGRYVPLFGLGQSREEAVRALANLCRALGSDADPRGAEHALTMTLHAGAGTLPLRALAQGALDGSAPAYLGQVALAYVATLGASDALREQVARELVGPPGLSVDLALALGAGGGDFGTFREHYAALTTSSENDAPAVRAARAWFDFVLARRFSGLDAMHALETLPALDPATRWLLHAGDLVAGDEHARARLAETAEQILGPLRPLAPRLLTTVARELAELVQHPLALRFAHLRCAAARDHAAAAIRAWLTAAVEPDVPDEAPLGEIPAMVLGPEPTRAGRAAIAARTAAGEFLLDWFVPDREARETVDSFARRALRLYHRLRGAQLLVRLERELRPPGGTLSATESVVWGGIWSR